MWIKGNRYLTQAEQNNNAEIVKDIFIDYEWSLYAICAMLGNMVTESNINPGIWQYLDAGNLNMGFGLTQWTPATKIRNWLKENGYEYDSGEGQCARIQWEVLNKQQWIKTSKYNFSFLEFTKMEPEEGESVEEFLNKMADAFLKNYERPKNQNQPIRGKNANYYWELFGGEEPEEPENPGPVWPKPEEPIEPGSVVYLYKWCNTYYAITNSGLTSYLSNIIQYGNYIFWKGDWFVENYNNIYKLIKN